jgi:hypothetical protein
MSTAVKRNSGRLKPLMRFGLAIRPCWIVQTRRDTIAF